jgi:hypothetical protein
LIAGTRPLERLDSSGGADLNLFPPTAEFSLDLAVAITDR